ncbi:MAG: TrbI/VirB10 family protein [Sphingomonadales bacterium]|nr:MAG: TrbI/VirB10 family protein [Sphingomonadales bacterium]
MPPVQPVPVQPQIVYIPQPGPPGLPPPVAAQRGSSAPVLVVDNGAATVVEEPSQAVAARGGAGDGASAASGAPLGGGRTRAGMFANRSTTVPQGTLIPAVLETAFDSTRPGFARAIVSRDVYGFDGARVLIPRGSRLIGEYSSQVESGQNRALVNWTRLIRPDGVTIAIGSPAADTLGRGGIKAGVNSHFFERFAGGILQSALDIGVNLASARLGNGTVVVALPGTLQNSIAPVVQQRQPTPTLTVPQGRSISVFVARDLDFTSAEARK